MNEIEEKVIEKNYTCERCGREIIKRGRCLPCNYFYKYKAYYPGLRRCDEYDKMHNFNTELVRKLLEEKKYKPDIVEIVKLKERKSQFEIGLLDDQFVDKKHMQKDYDSLCKAIKDLEKNLQEDVK